MDGIKQTIANSPYPENAQAKYLNFVEKHQSECLGKPFNDITDPDELSPIQRARADKDNPNNNHRIDKINVIFHSE